MFSGVTGVLVVRIQYDGHTCPTRVTEYYRSLQTMGRSPIRDAPKNFIAILYHLGHDFSICLFRLKWFFVHKNEGCQKENFDSLDFRALFTQYSPMGSCFCAPRMVGWVFGIVRLTYMGLL